MGDITPMGFDKGDTNFGLSRSPPSVRSATMATNRIVGTSTFGFIEIARSSNNGDEHKHDCTKYNL